MAKNNNSVKQKDKLVLDLESQMDRLDEALKSLKGSIDVIQKGNGKFPYWNGSNACIIIKNTLTQYQTDKELLKYIKECKSALKK